MVNRETHRATAGAALQSRERPCNRTLKTSTSSRLMPLSVSLGTTGLLRCLPVSSNLDDAPCAQLGLPAEAAAMPVPWGCPAGVDFIGRWALSP